MKIFQDLNAEGHTIVMITHEAREADDRQAMAEIDQLPIVSPPTVFYRIEDPHLNAAQI